jgi:hypothetical protein
MWQNTMLLRQLGQRVNMQQLFLYTCMVAVWYLIMKIKWVLDLTGYYLMFEAWAHLIHSKNSESMKVGEHAYTRTHAHLCYNICFPTLDEWPSLPIRSLGIPTRALRCCLALESGCLPPTHKAIIYIKANVVSVCVDKNWVVLGRFFQSLSVSCGASL